MRSRALRALEDTLEGGEAPGWPGGLEPGAVRRALTETLSATVSGPLSEPALSALAAIFARWYRRGRLVAAPGEASARAALDWPQRGLVVVPWPTPARRASFSVAAGEVRLERVSFEPGPGARVTLDTVTPLSLSGGHLTLRFHHRPGVGGRQEVHDRAAVAAVLDALPPRWREPLAAGGRRSLLARQLARFTASSPSWRLVHPDLSAVLSPALDALLLPLLDEAEGELSTFLAARAMGRTLIAGLSEGARSLHERWCAAPTARTDRWIVSLDRLPDGLRALALVNPAQRRWWAEHLKVTEPERHAALPVDTAHFPESFRARVAERFAGEIPTGICIKGENRRALSWLQGHAAGSVRAIYLDPPYNTGLNFLGYPDRLPSGVWLSAMADRFALARELLREDGTLFASIDDREGARLKLLLGELFGEENHLATLVWEKVHTRKNSSRTWSIQHEYVHVVARDAKRWTRRLMPRGDATAYKNPDDDPRGPWKPDPVTAHNPYGADYTITRPDGEVLRPPPERYWAFSEENFKRMEAAGAVIWGERGYPMIKRYLADVQDGLVPVTLLSRKVAGDSSRARRELREMFGGALVFDYPKPVALLREVLYPATPDADDVILDFFAGSGSTAQAVMGLNRQDGGRRRFILVERGEVFERALLARVQKALFADRWRAGCPIESEPLGHLIQIVSLKLWEETLFP